MGFISHRGFESLSLRQQTKRPTQCRSFCWLVMLERVSNGCATDGAPRVVRETREGRTAQPNPSLSASKMKRATQCGSFRLAGASSLCDKPLREARRDAEK